MFREPQSRRVFATPGRHPAHQREAAPRHPPFALHPLYLHPIAGRRAAPMLDLLTLYLRVWHAWSSLDQWLRCDAGRSGR
jgi:hypothetical protein